MLSGANSKPRDRGRTSRRLFNPDFRNQFLTISAIARKFTTTRPQALQTSLTQHLKRRSRRPGLAAEKSRRRVFVATAIVVVDAGVGVGGRSSRLSLRKLLRCRSQVARLVKPRKRMLLLM